MTDAQKCWATVSSIGNARSLTQGEGDPAGDAVAIACTSNNANSLFMRNITSGRLHDLMQSPHCDNAR